MTQTGKTKRARVIAFYLPQFHPIRENDLWWGKGFTEWTNVIKGRPLFRGHHQPHVPADLGYYDLLDPQVRQKQAELAREAGVDGFCYWHYWFGNGRQLLEKPLQEVIRLGEPDFPFCLGWANHNWEKKLWNSEISPLSKQLLAKQLYPGVEDIDRHFYTMLPAFKDPRYMRMDNRLVFLIYTPHENPLMQTHIERWQELAKKEGLGGFYFIAQCRRKEELDMYRNLPFDALNYDCLFYFFNQGNLRKLAAHLFNWAITTPYKAVLNKYDTALITEDVYPTIYPKWDTTPRRGYVGTIFTGSTPALFKQHVKQIIDATRPNTDGEKVIFLKSWNEWAEGNYMEPDTEFGHQYLEALHEALYDE